MPRADNPVRPFGWVYGCDAEGLVAQTVGEADHVLQRFVFAAPSL